MSSPDLSPVGVKWPRKNEKRSVSSSTTIAVVPESDALPAPATAHTTQNDPADFDPSVGAKPYSPFYRHATPSISLVKLKANAKAPPSPGADSLYDLEDQAGNTTQEAMGQDGSHRESKLWAQKKRRCGCMKSLSKKQRLVLKAVIAIGTLGSMMAIALGITAAVGGGVWRSDHQHRVLG
ncbi:hypothetical protein P170DRAFT_432364 [Aspergillus steynii IBT 23096]|uniref:Uncharacterized protein n=1 Tax=Aspergillus steynii IBT 23096 TaxID=1392250 RepID=A0A2I2GPH5_9EURO|nr:uncharacterized protein P170DRAFT_432364 [Aspergillus steynii IBT 23096]PLB54780.1 hypothetical protein P170DRAFT_432364 [Aspergillus steynii IBT 23096]